jgi:hypothetical protein
VIAFLSVIDTFFRLTQSYEFVPINRSHAALAAWPLCKPGL